MLLAHNEVDLGIASEKAGFQMTCTQLFSVG